MSAKLKNFIDMNRQQMDSFVPSSNVWLKINAGMQQPALIKNNASSWLKYFTYGASAVAIVAGLGALLSRNVNTPASTAPAISIASTPETPLPSVIATDTVSESTSGKTTVSDVPAVEKTNAAAEIIYEPAPVYMQAAAEKNIPEARPELPEIPATAVNHSSYSKAFRNTKNDSLSVDTAFAGITHFELTVSSCDINVKPSGTALINFKASIRTKERGILIGENKFDVEYEKKDSVLKVRIINKSSKHMVIAGSSIVDASIDLAIPDNISLGIDDKYGDVTIEGIKTKKYNVQTSSGDIKINNASGQLKLNANYGDIKLADLKGDMDVLAGSGDLKITSLDGNAVLNLSYGNAILKNITGNMNINSSSGDIKINKMTGDLDIVSKYGNIRLEDYKGTPKLEAISGDITGKNVELQEGMTTDCRYGDVDMKLLNSFADLSFDLSTRYGTISLPDTKTSENPARLQVTKGKIIVKGYTASGDQTYR